MFKNEAKWMTLSFDRIFRNCGVCSNSLGGVTGMCIKALTQR